MRALPEQSVCARSRVLRGIYRARQNGQCTKRLARGQVTSSCPLPSNSVPRKMTCQRYQSSRRAFIEEGPFLGEGGGGRVMRARLERLSRRERKGRSLNAPSFPEWRFLASALIIGSKASFFSREAGQFSSMDVRRALFAKNSGARPRNREKETCLLERDP